MPDLDAGMAEKIVPLVLFPVLLRVVLPGALATAFAYPILLTYWPNLVVNFTGDFKDHWQQFVFIAAMVFVLGALTSALNGEIYKIYEGRTFWPSSLLRWALAKQKGRVKELQHLADSLRTQKERVTEYSETWYKLRRYPLDENNKPYADRPTLLGNILSGYEQYPKERYGMDSVFYWTRLWMEMEKEKKEEIDSSWSVADGFLSLSAVSFLGGFVWLLVAALSALHAPYLHMPLSGLRTSVVGAVSILTSCAFYRVSLPFHRQNGELFKSIFDLYRDKVWRLTDMKVREKEIWDETWNYLQYLQVPCRGKLPDGRDCTQWNYITVKTCPKCRTEVSRSLPPQTIEASSGLITEPVPATTEPSAGASAKPAAGAHPKEHKHNASH